MSRNRSQEEHCAGGIRCAASSDIGMRRANNQDAYAISLDQALLAEGTGYGETEDRQSLGHLFVVADGMGAHAAGELASQLAADTIPHSYSKRCEGPRVQALVDAVRDANHVIFTKGQDSVDFHGMGTTCSCLLMHSGVAYAVHVGDSRIYRLRGQVLEQLTFDHSLVWELAAAGNSTEEAVPAYVPKNVITRSLGPNDLVNIDVEGPFPLHRGDRFLLCSDGLTGPLSNELIGMVLAALPANKAAQTLVDLANLLGGPDNITVIVAEVSEPGRLEAEDSGVGGAPTEAKWFPSPQDRRSPRDRLSALLGWSVLRGWLFGGRADRRQTEASSGSAGSHPRGPGKTNAHGKSPYRQYACQPQAKNIEILSDIVRQLEDMESSRDWQIDWQEIQNDRHLAHQAIARGEFDAAVVAYSSVVRQLMASLRKSAPCPSSDSDIGLC